MKFGLSTIILLLLWAHAFAQKEIPYTLEDRERLIRLEEQMKDLNQKIDAQNEKFEAKFDAQNEKFSMLFTLIYFVLGGIMGLMGFVLWDRRTFLKPVKDENKELSKRNEKLEKALKDFAKYQPKLAEALRSCGIL